VLVPEEDAAPDAGAPAVGIVRSGSGGVGAAPCLRADRAPRVVRRRVHRARHAERGGVVVVVVAVVPAVLEPSQAVTT
jgi:hypothetical protein